MKKEVLTLVTVRHGIVDSAIVCKDVEELHDRFADEILSQGQTPEDEDFDLGYREFENDRSVSMVHAITSDELPAPSGRRVNA